MASYRWIVVLSILVSAAFARPSMAQPQPSANATNSTPIALHYRTNMEGGIAGHLPAIMAQQAVLLAMREQLQLDIEDGIFLDRPNEPSAPEAYVLEVKASMEGTFSMHLLHQSAEAPNAVDKTNALWSFEFPYKVGSKITFPSLIPQLELASRQQMLEIAEKWNRAGSSNRWVETSQLPDTIVTNLEHMDLISQSLAVREAHRLMREQGESPELLGVLVRGYAHLSLLTRQNWFLSSDVFSCRSLLYAQRLVARAPEQALARWYRAYSSALSGLHLYALEDLEWLEGQRQDPDTFYPASWCRLIEPVCKYDFRRLEVLANEDSSIEQVAMILRFLAVTTTQDDELIMEVGQETLQQTPGAFDIYHRIAAGHTLGFERWAAATAPSAVSNTLLALCAEKTELPEEVVSSAKRPAPRPGLAKLLFGNGRQSTRLRDIRKIAELLRQADTNASSAGISWSILARLIEEELFLLAVDQLHNATNAVESDLGDLVAEYQPLVEGHPLEAYVAAHAFNRITESQARRAALDRITPQVLRWHMRDLYSAISYDASPEVWEQFGKLLTREFTAQDLELAFSIYRESPDFQKMLARELRHVSPFSPYVLRFAISSTPDADIEKIKEWETAAAEDSLALLEISRHYSRLQMTTDAVRCLERSLTLRQSLHAAHALASIYWQQKEYAQWQTVWVTFLDTAPSYNLEHAAAQEQLARGLMFRDQLDDALPYALQAAETYSYSGLQIAALCFEARKEYDQAEIWWQRSSEAYGGRSRLDWYLFCRRTGTGNVEAALELARQTMDEVLAQGPSDLDTAFAIVEMLEGALPEALKLLQREIEKSHDSWHYTQLGLMALSLQDRELRDSIATELQQHLTQTEPVDGNSPSVMRMVAAAVAQRLDNQPVDDKTVQSILDRFDELGQIERDDINYFLGEILSSQEDTRRAAGMWVAALSDTLNSQRLSISLAGHRLQQQAEIEPLAWQSAPNPNER
ncbi:MAG: hypothetical protein IT422_03480 [Pirellulaceae bacterium]|nr:hypothetical protein [Pirellulaceae bacterium]